MLINRLLKANARRVLAEEAGKADGEDLGTGAIWVPASAAARPVLEKSAKDLGVPVHAVAKAPTGDALKLKPIRIGLYDQYGGSHAFGLDALAVRAVRVSVRGGLSADARCGRSEEQVRRAGLHRRCDSRAATPADGGGGGGGFGGRPDPADHPGRVSAACWAASPTTRPCRSSRSSWNPAAVIVTIGSSTSMAEVFGLPVKNHLVEKGPDGKDRALPREKFYIPGSLLKVNVDNTNPLAYGMPTRWTCSSTTVRYSAGAHRSIEEDQRGRLVHRRRGAG